MDHALGTIMLHAMKNDALEEEGRFPDTEQDEECRRSKRLAKQGLKLFDQCEESSVESHDSTVQYDDCNIKGIECEESSHSNNNNNDDNEDESSDMEDFISDNDDVNSERSSMFSTQQQQLDIQRRKRKRILEDDSDDEEPPKKITKATVTAVVQQQPPPPPPPVIRVPQVPLLKSIISSQKRDRHTTIDRYCMPHVTTKQDTDWLQRVKDLSDYIVERRRDSRNHNPGYIRNINEDSSLERWAIGQRKKNLDRWKVCILLKIGFVF